MSAKRSSSRQQAAKVPANDAYQLNSYSYLRLGSSSSSSSAVSSTRSLVMPMVTTADDTQQTSSRLIRPAEVSSATCPAQNRASAAEKTLRNSDTDDDNDDDGDDDSSTRSFLQSPRVMKASLNRKLLAFTTNADKIARVSRN